jgi:FkbM family methyltransferase
MNARCRATSKRYTRLLRGDTEAASEEGIAVKHVVRRLAGKLLRPVLARLVPMMPPVPLQLYPGHTQAELGLIREYFRLDPTPEPGFITDRLGVRTDVAALWDDARTLAGTVLPPPLEADFHAEAIEWIGLLKSVSGASGRFAAMELGAGWGPWLVAGAAAARLRGIDAVRLLGVEADPVHFDAMRAHLRNNGLDPDQHRLHCAAVGVTAGTARWPRVADARNEWGGRPVDAAAPSDAEMMQVEVIPIARLLEAEPVWDLVHIDVQGAEAELCRAAIGLLCGRVRWLIIGTHSRIIEGELMALLHGAGWALENEKPCRFSYSAKAASAEAMTTLDGTQVWRNPLLAGG